MENFHNKSVDDALIALHSSRKGLTQKEAVARYERGEKNEIDSDKKKSIFFQFLEQFKDLMILILLIAAAISIVIGLVQKTVSEIIDGGIIFAIVLMNAVFGVVQETSRRSVKKN